MTKFPFEYPIHIFVRLKDAPEFTPWTQVGFAHTEEQAAAAIERWKAIAPEYDYESKPAELNESPTTEKIQAELKELRAWKTKVVDNSGTDDPDEIGKLFHKSKAHDKRLATEAREVARLEKEKNEAAEVAGKPAPDRKFPFAVGDVVHDAHSGTAVEVTKIHLRPENPIGFEWKSIKGTDLHKGGETTGHAPFESVQYFSKTAKKKKSSPPKKKKAKGAHPPKH